MKTSIVTIMIAFLITTTLVAVKSQYQPSIAAIQEELDINTAQAELDCAIDPEGANCIHGLKLIELGKAAIAKRLEVSK